MIQKCQICLVDANLSYLDISNFDVSSVSTMANMFNGSASLISLNLSNFNPKKVVYMSDMFAGCSSLTYLTLFNSKTTNLKSCSSMFSGCSSLISLDLTNLDISKVEFLTSLFNKCSSLVSLNLSSFNTSKALSMNLMFKDCSSLISLDLSNFDTSSKNLTKNNDYGYKDIFKLTSPELIICIDDEELKNILSNNSTTIYCKNDLNQESFYNSTDCFNNISNIIIYDINNLQICNSDFSQVENSKCYINLDVCSTDFHFETYSVTGIKESTLTKTTEITQYITESYINISDTSYNTTINSEINTMIEKETHLDNTFLGKSSLLQYITEYSENESETDLDNTFLVNSSLLQYTTEYSVHESNSTALNTEI